MGKPIGAGIVGLGSISGSYLDRLSSLAAVEVVAVADVDEAQAASVARERAIPALSVEGLLSHPGVAVVVNLTPPDQHAEIALRAVSAGRAVYNEKPFAVTVSDGRRVLEVAAAAGVRVGSAPDTVLGTGVQTARAAVDAGLIGQPTAASASFFCPGHESWHPNPDFYYHAGGGPLFDMGPYYLTTLVTLLGPVLHVIAGGNTARPTRTIGSGPRAGHQVGVDVLTHVSALLTHASGAVSTVTMSFDACASEAPPIEVHGPLGSLSVPDPNRFAGPVRLHLAGEESWRTLEPCAGYTSAGRGLGVVDLVTAPDVHHVRASGSLGLHILDIMESAIRSAGTGARVTVQHQVERPPPVPLSVEPAFDT